MDRDIVRAGGSSGCAGLWKIGVALLCLMSLVGCRDAYRDKSEEMYNALMQLRADVENNADMEQFARHLSTADEIHEQWAKMAGNHGASSRCTHEVGYAMQFYGRLGTMRMLKGSPCVDHSSVDHFALARADDAMLHARRDLDIQE